MQIGQINFGPAGRFDYEIQLPSIAKAAEKVVEFINLTDEKVVIEYLAKSNQKALERLKRLIEEALKTHQPTNGFMAAGSSEPSAQICPK